MSKAILIGGLSSLLGVCAIALVTIVSPHSPVASAQDPGGVYVAPVEIDTAALAGPRQPVFFRHDLHAGQYAIQCQYCHFSVDTSWEPGIPSMETCVGCHRIAPGRSEENRAEIQKLTAAFSEGRPIEWVRIHSLPEFVQFPHMRHIKALGPPPESCANCHGQINRMAQVSQQQSLKMGWCVDCHTQRNVTIDCTSCHY